MLRLIAYLEDGSRRFPLLRSDLLLGHRADCDICLPFPGVGAEHARLLLKDGVATLVDLGARTGIQVNGEKVEDRVILKPLDEIKVGRISLLLEEVKPAPAKKSKDTMKKERVSRMTPARYLGHLSKVSHWVIADAVNRKTLENLVGSMLDDFGGGALFLLQTDAVTERESVRLTVVTDATWLGASPEIWDRIQRRIRDGQDAVINDLETGENRPAAWVGGFSFSALARPYTVIFVLPRFVPGRWNPAPGMRSLGELLVLGMVHHVGRFEPILLGQTDQSELVTAPGMVVGESPAMKSLLEQMRTVIKSPVHVLLEGETGTGAREVAHSLHLSSKSRQGPFVVVEAQGADPTAVEADLFGAEVRGRGGQIFRREGRLMEADGGSLLIFGVETLPLNVQGKLMRYLRTGEFEPVGSLEQRRSRVRIVGYATENLDPLVARAAFRLDLAYHLGQIRILLPPLRNRREDLPLLIQAAFNRFCHETGKRVRGIGLKAMSLLTAYDYPGNLLELDNIVRHLVYLCPPSQPIDVTHLPETVRTAPLRGYTAKAETSDLHLGNLVPAVEKSAIREALRRSRGNRSQSARLLGISRNGLMMKMKRYGIE